MPGLPRRLGYPKWRLVQDCWERAIYPAVQNMLLAARALGLGATRTTLLQYEEEDGEAMLGLPENARSYAILPIGCPEFAVHRHTRRIS